MDEFEATHWAEEYERSGKAAHLFTPLDNQVPRKGMGASR